MTLYILCFQLLFRTISMTRVLTKSQEVDPRTTCGRSHLFPLLLTSCLTLSPAVGRCPSWWLLMPSWHQALRYEHSGPSLLPVSISQLMEGKLGSCLSFTTAFSFQKGQKHVLCFKHFLWGCLATFLPKNITFSIHAWVLLPALNRHKHKTTSTPVYTNWKLFWSRVIQVKKFVK